jgi:hypothetical protein
MPFNKAHLNLARMSSSRATGAVLSQDKSKLIRRPGHAISNCRGLLLLITGDFAVTPRGQCTRFHCETIKTTELFVAGEMGVDGYLAQQKFTGAHVRFGSKADIGAYPPHVRFTPKSGHWRARSACDGVLCFLL